MGASEIEISALWRDSELKVIRNYQGSVQRVFIPSEKAGKTWPDGVIVTQGINPDHNGPDVIEEALKFRKSFFDAVLAVIHNDQELSNENKAELLNIIHYRLTAFENAVKKLTDTHANIDYPNSHPTNKAFYRAYATVNQLREELMADVCNILKIRIKLDNPLKVLEKAGNILRGRKRPAIFSTWKDPQTNRTCFILYEPMGHFTDEQLRAKNETDKSKRRHATTSHQKENWEGTSNFIKVTNGIIDDNNQAKILYQGFRHGSLTPYKNYKHTGRAGIFESKASKIKRLDVLATTIRNQKEVLTAIAREKYSDPSQIIEVKESYMQLISPGQWFSRILGEYDEQQFQDACFAFDIYNGRRISTAIDENHTSQLDVDVSMMCMGVNLWRNFRYAKQKRQNIRGFNELHQQVYDFFSQKLKNGYISHRAKLDQDISEYLMPDNKSIIDCNRLIQELKNQLKEKAESFEKTLLDFSLFDIAKKKASYRQVYRELNEIEKIRQRIYQSYLKLDRLRKQHWQRSKTKLAEIFTTLDSALSVNAAHCLDDIKAIYNIFHLFVDLQELKYNKLSKDAENNFYFQSLYEIINFIMGRNPSSGCKSNNDRGQALANITATTLFHIGFNQQGLYRSGLGCFTHTPWKDCNLAVVKFGPGAVHCELNTGVAGGKFTGANAGFHNPYLRAKIDKWGKLSTQPFWNKHKRKLLHGVIAILLGLVLFGVSVILDATIAGSLASIPLSVFALGLMVGGGGLVAYAASAFIVELSIYFYKDYKSQKRVAEYISNAPKLSATNNSFVKMLDEFGAEFSLKGIDRNISDISLHPDMSPHTLLSSRDLSAGSRNNLPVNGSQPIPGRDDSNDVLPETDNVSRLC